MPPHETTLWDVFFADVQQFFADLFGHMPAVCLGRPKKEDHEGAQSPATVVTSGDLDIVAATPVQAEVFEEPPSSKANASMQWALSGMGWRSSSAPAAEAPEESVVGDLVASAAAADESGRWSKVKSRMGSLLSYRAETTAAA